MPVYSRTIGRQVLDKTKGKPKVCDLLSAGTGLRYKKDTLHKREHTAVSKQKPRTRLARRGSRLVRVTGLEPAAP